MPPAGYKSYEIVNGPGTIPSDAAATVSGAGSNMLENSAIRVYARPEWRHRQSDCTNRGNTEFAGAGMKMNDLSPGETAGTITVENRAPFR